MQSSPVINSVTHFFVALGVSARGAHLPLAALLSSLLIAINISGSGYDDSSRQPQDLLESNQIESSRAEPSEAEAQNLALQRQLRSTLEAIHFEFERRTRRGGRQRPCSSSPSAGREPRGPRADPLHQPGPILSGASMVAQSVRSQKGPEIDRQQEAVAAATDARRTIGTARICSSLCTSPLVAQQQALRSPLGCSLANCQLTKAGNNGSGERGESSAPLPGCELRLWRGGAFMGQQR